MEEKRKLELDEEEEERMLEINRRVSADLPLTRAETEAWRRWILLPPRRRKRKKRKKRRPPLGRPHLPSVAALVVVYGNGMLLAGFLLCSLCSLLTLAGLSFQTSLSVWTRSTVFIALVVNSSSGICWAGLTGCSSRCVPCCRFQARDARHHGRYGPGGQYCAHFRQWHVQGWFYW